MSLPSKVAIVGAGAMGAGIAVRYGLAGAAVTLTSRREATLASARERIASALGDLVAHDIVAATARDAALRRISSTLDLEAAVAGAGLVVESIAEDPDVKRSVLARVEAAAPSDAVLTSNTSSLSLGDLARDLSRPARFAGYHWFNPAELVDLVEVVRAPVTDAAVAERLIDWTRAVGARPVLVRRDVPGFVANRLQYALLREAFALVEAGVCTVEDVDAVVTTGLGARWAAVGPIEGSDLSGLHIAHAVATQLFPALATATEPPAALTALVEQGERGCATGRGLRGAYPPEAVARLRARRAQVMLALRRHRPSA